MTRFELKLFGAVVGVMILLGAVFVGCWEFGKTLADWKHKDHEPVTVTNVTLTNYVTIMQVVVVTNYYPTEPMPYKITNPPIERWQLWMPGIITTNNLSMTNFDAGRIVIDQNGKRMK